MCTSGAALVIQPLSGTAPGFSAQAVRHATLVSGVYARPGGPAALSFDAIVECVKRLSAGSVSFAEHAISGPIIADTFAVTACDSIIDAPLRASPAVVAGSVSFSRHGAPGSVGYARAAIKDSVLLDRLLGGGSTAAHLPSHTACCRMTPTLGQTPVAASRSGRSPSPDCR